MRRSDLPLYIPGQFRSRWSIRRVLFLAFAHPEAAGSETRRRVPLLGMRPCSGRNARSRRFQRSSRCVFSLILAHSSASAGASFFSVIEGQTLASSALSAI